MFFNPLLLAGAMLPATYALPSAVVASTPEIITLGPTFDIPSFTMGAVESLSDAATSLYCDLQPARLCKTSDATSAAQYLTGLGSEGVDCQLIAPFGDAQTGVRMVIYGTASVVLTSRKVGNVTTSCGTAASLLEQIIDSCQVKTRVKGLMQVPAADYTAKGFKPDGRTVSIYVEHV